MVRAYGEMPAIEIIVELGDGVDNGKPFFFQLQIFLFSRVEGSGNEGNGSFFSSSHPMRKDSPQAILRCIALNNQRLVWIVMHED